MRLSYYRLKRFWCGIVVFIFLLVAWWDSSKYTTWFSWIGETKTHLLGFDITSENGTVSFYAGRTYLGGNTTGVKFCRNPYIPTASGNKLSLPISIKLTATGLIKLKVAHWTILGLYAIVWMIALGARQFRRRQ